MLCMPDALGQLDIKSIVPQRAMLPPPLGSLDECSPHVVYRSASLTTERDVLRRCQELAEILALLGPVGLQLYARQLGDAVDSRAISRPEQLFSMSSNTLAVEAPRPQVAGGVPSTVSCTAR